jgi:hypothetical protein
MTLLLPDGPMEISLIVDEAAHQQGNMIEAPFTRIHVCGQVPFTIAGTWVTISLPDGQRQRVYVWKVRHRLGRSSVTVVAPELLEREAPLDAPAASCPVG